MAASSHAAEIPLETSDFTVSHKIEATALPRESVLFSISPEQWTEFKILSIADHGSAVKKGDSLLVLDSISIDETRKDLRNSITEASLQLASAEAELAVLKKTVPDQINRLERKAAEAAEELTYFIKTQRKASEEQAEFEVKSKQQILASYKEELKQLLQMYEADDITEETEEIILQQQKDAVEAAQFSLKMEVQNQKRTVGVALPRREKELTELRDDSALKFDTQSKELPRSIELGKIKVDSLKTSLQRTKKELAKLDKDRSLFEIKAPAEGIFYHGSIDDGKWETEGVLKHLKPGGSLPLHESFGTFISSTVELAAFAFPDQKIARAITTGTKGLSIFVGRGDVAFPVTLESISETPGPDLTYKTIFAPEWPEGFVPKSGQKLEIQMVSYFKEAAITVPTKALSYQPEGWTVELKLADGTTEKRRVTLGKSISGETEITAGLQPGQVIVTP